MSNLFLNKNINITAVKQKKEANNEYTN